jgi:hypothetical protein
MRSGRNELLGTVLQAKQKEVDYLRQVKDEQIASLKEQLVAYSKLVDHERARAEAAIDRLLFRETQLPPIANADILRSQGEADTLRAEEARIKDAQLASVFKSINDTGEDDSRSDGPTEILSSIGGFPVNGVSEEVLLKPLIKD